MDDTVREWREAEQAGDLVLLDGFHALKHALRFGADVRMVIAEDPAAVRALARELAPDVEASVVRLARRADLKGVLTRVHPTGVAALAVRPDRAAGIAGLGRLPRPAPVVVLDNPRNLGNVGAVVRLAAGFGATGVVTRGDLDPWHPNVVRAGAGLHYATIVERLALDELPPGRSTRSIPRARTSAPSPSRTTPCSPSARSATGSHRSCVPGRTTSSPCRCVPRSPATTSPPVWP